MFSKNQAYCRKAITMTAASQKESSRVITIVAIMTALSLLGDSMLYIALPIYWREAGLDSIWQVGILLSVNRFIRLPFHPFVGWMYQKISLKTGLMTAIVLAAVTTIGYGVCSGFAAWLFLRALWGVSWSFFRIGGLAAVAHYAEEKHRGAAMGQYNGLYRLGSLFGMLLGGLFVPLVGLKPVALVFGGLVLLGLPLLMALPLDNRAESRKQTPKHGSSVNRHASKWLVIISGFLITMLVQGVFTSTLSAVIERYYGGAVTLFGFVLSVTFLSGLIQSARWLWEPYLGKKFGHWSDGSSGRLPLYICSLLFIGLTFGMISQPFSFSIWVAVTCLAMAAATCLTTVNDALALDAAKTSNVVPFLTVYSIAQDVGAAIGPLLSYLVIQWNYGFLSLYGGGAAVFMLLAFIWAIVYAKEKRPPSQFIGEN
jgi:MFS family permease